MRYFYLLIIAIIIQGCATKEYFEPKDYTILKYKGYTNSYLIDSRLEGATFEDGSIVTNNKFYKDIIKSKKTTFINETKKYLILTDKNSTILVDKQTKAKEYFGVGNKALSANIKDNLLAILQSENILFLFDIQTKKILFKSKQKNIYATTSHIAKPVFLDDLILYPTLDGKVVVYDTEKKQEIKSFIVSNEQYFNNISFLEVHDNNIFAASRHKIIRIGNKRVDEFEEEMNFVIYFDGFLYVGLVNGKVLKLNKMLNKLTSSKFKFAGLIRASIKDNHLFILERNGYLIKSDLDLEKNKIFALNDNVENFVFINNQAIYYKKRYIKLP